MSEYRALSTEEIEALQAFAKAFGRKWKDELSNVYWYNARLWRGPKGDDNLIGSTLHRLRNDLGPTWLYDHCKLPKG